MYNTYGRTMHNNGDNTLSVSQVKRLTSAKY